MKDYFSHDYNSRNDKKLIKAFMKYKLEAIGAYWCIVEMLYEEGGYLPLSEYERITFELRTSNELITYLLHESELFKNDGVLFWSETAIERLKLRAEKSQKARESIEKRWERKNNTNVLKSNNEGNTSKIKESKNKLKEYPQELIDLNERCKFYFDEKYINEKSMECFNTLVNKGYVISDIKKAILNGRNDEFWNKQFQSPLKLNKKDKCDVLFIDVFLKLKSNNNVKDKPKDFNPVMKKLI